MRRMTISLIACLGVSLGAGLTPCFAQGAPSAPAKAAEKPAPVSTDPESTSATYGDWVLHCVRTTGQTGPKTCEAVQSIMVKGQSAPFAQIVFARPNGTEPLRLTVLLPHNVGLTVRPRVELTEGKPSSFDLTWRRSLPGGCVADAVATDDDLRKLRAVDAKSRIVFNDAGDHELALPWSLRGLSQVLDALAKS
jgi:invasion protein IalB